MELKERKAILNGVLPKFDLGLSNLPSMDLDGLNKKMLDSGLFVKNSTGGLEPNMLAGKAAKGNILGGLANKAGGIMNIASGALDFVGTIGDISTNKISSDEMMGSGGTTTESANGISYQQSKVDEAGYLNQIDATAKAGTMAAMGKGAALGGAVGSVIPGLGTVAGGVIGGVVGGIAGLFGSRKAKREAERQKRIAIDRTKASNTLNRETAYTIGLRNEFNRENRTDTSQSLFHAEEGIEDIERDVDPRKMRTKHKYLADTAEHGVVSGHINGLGSFGETMISGKADENGMHKVHRIKRGPNDTAPMDLKKHDTVGSRRFIDYETGLPIADAIYLNAMAHGGKISTEDKQRYEMNLNIERMKMYSGKKRVNPNPGYLGGTLRKFNLGDEDLSSIKAAYYGSPEYLTQQYGTAQPAASATPGTTSTSTSGKSALGKLGAGLKTAWGAIKNAGVDLDNLTTLGGAFINAAQRDAQTEGGIRAPKSFVANPYENAALDELNKLHSDYYTVWAGNREAEGRAKSSIAQSGGLSAGQRMLAYMGMLNQTLQNNANAMFDAQKLNNEYRGQAAKIKLATGENSATRQAEAYRWDEDMLAKAHAARLNMWETSAYDRQNALESFFHNRFKKNQFDRTMNLYESQLKNDEAATRALIDNLNNTNTNNTVATQTTPTLADKASSVTTTAGNASIHPGQTALPLIIPTIKAQPLQPVVNPTIAKRENRSISGVKKPAARRAEVISSNSGIVQNKQLVSKIPGTIVGNTPATTKPLKTDRSEYTKEDIYAIGKKPRSQRTLAEQLALTMYVLLEIKDRKKLIKNAPGLFDIIKNRNQAMKKSIETRRQQNAIKNELKRKQELKLAGVAAKRKNRPINQQAASKFESAIGGLPMFNYNRQ